MAMTRESAFLPTIKCSLCGGQVEISMMGEHVCPGPSAELSPPPDSTEEFEDSYSSDKYGRRTPPHLNTDSANRSYMHRGQLTPVSNTSVSRSASPGSPTRQPRRLDTPDHFTTTRHSPVQKAGRPGGYGGFGQRDGSDNEQSEAPRSADKPTGGWGGLLQRMNTIAPGPFDASGGRKPSTTRNPSPTHKDSPTKWDEFDTLMEPPHPVERPGTSHSNTSVGSGGMAPPRAPRKNGYGGFGPPPSDNRSPEPSPLGLINRSETFPKPTLAAEPPSRRPSAPNPRSDRMGTDARRQPSGPDTSRPPPPRTSLIPTHKSGNFSGAVNIAAEFGIGNPYHTPSGSGSSGYSEFTDPSLASSRTSPARSQRLPPSKPAQNDDAMASLQPSMENLRSRDLRIDASVQDPARSRSPMTGSPYVMSPREERNDPAIQSGRPTPPRSGYDRQAPPARYESSPQREQDMTRSDYSQGRNGVAPPGPRGPPVRQNSRDPNLPSRGDCKACGLAISGKSVSSADGRLTGKYHKACFVCTSCSEPFTSAEFYVLSDKPYCEQHYHKLNGSLCGSCGRGIEGQYLEDEERVKYHVGCFQCLDCGRSLSDGYFEVDGKSYCERDAWKRVQQMTAPPIPAQPDYSQQPQLPRAGPGSRRPPNGRPPQARGPGPAPGRGGPRSYGVAPGTRAGPGMGPAGKPQMNKRMTRLGMM